MALPAPVTAKTTEEGENERLDYAVSAMQGWRVNMEDAHATVLNLDATTGTSFFGVYDGHGGPAVSKYCARHLHLELRKHENFRDNPRVAIERTFLRMDGMMKDRRAGKELSEDGGNENWEAYRKAMRKTWFIPFCQKPAYRGPETDGCTACVVLIRGNQIIVGNAGDSRCVLSRNDQAVDLSRDFKPTLAAERQRIEAAGHAVTVTERGTRIDDGIAISRSLGDLRYKDNNDLGHLEQAITAFPEVRTEEITQQDQFLIIACDGIWVLISAVALAVPIILKNTEEGENERLDYAVSAMQGQSENMEDVDAIVLNLDAATCKLFFGVYDGHGGTAVLKYFARHLHIVLFQDERFRDNLQIAIERILRMDDIINGFVCWFGSIHALWAALDPSGKIKSFSCFNEDIYKYNNLWSMLATTAGSSKASVTRKSAMVTQNNKSTDTSNSVSLRSNTRRARGEEDGEENGGPDGGRGQPKVHGGDKLMKVTVSSVEELENLDPNAVILSISGDAAGEAASEILREGNRRNFQFAKDKPYYKAVYACILENTESEETEGLDPDYHPSEEYDTLDDEEVPGEGIDEQPLDGDESDTRDEEEVSGEEIHEQPLDADESTIEDSTNLDSRWVFVEESDCPPSPATLPPSSPVDSYEPIPLEIIRPQPCGAVISPASEASELPSPQVAEDVQDDASPQVAEDVQDDASELPSPQVAEDVQDEDSEPPSVQVAEDVQDEASESPSHQVAEDVQGADDVTAESQSAPSAPPSSVGPLALNCSPPPPPCSTPAGPVALGTPENYSSPPPCSALAGPVALGIWMPAGRPQYAARLAFATVTPAEHAVNPSPFIRAALDAHLPQLHYNLLPSSRGTMLLRFDGAAERDGAVEHSPFNHNGGRVVLERVEDTSNRYRIPLPWLAAISATDFPPEHWFEDNIHAAFRCLGNVIEIDPDCLDETDYSSVRVVVEVARDVVPVQMGVNSHEAHDDGDGSIVQLRTVHVWERHLRFDAAGAYIPFFAGNRTAQRS